MKIFSMQLLQIKFLLYFISLKIFITNYNYFQSLLYLQNSQFLFKYYQTIPSTIKSFIKLSSIVSFPKTTNKRKGSIKERKFPESSGHGKNRFIFQGLATRSRVQGTSNKSRRIQDTQPEKIYTSEPSGWIKVEIRDDR